jgi:hypothetical protein
MSQNKKNIPMWAKTGHAKPVSRRDFLSAGLLPFAANIFMPNWLSVLASTTANAADSASCAVGSATLIPFATVNLSGGAAMAANFVPMNANGDPISSYSKLGLGDNQVPIEKEFGNVPFAGMNNGALISKFLQGLRTGATADTLSKTAFIGIPCESQNDTAGNRFDISGAVTNAGVVGSQLPNLGRVVSATGLHQAAAIVPPPSPLIVGSYTSLLSSIGYTATLGSALNQGQKEALTKLVSNLSTSQSRKLASINNGSGVMNVLECAGINNVDIVHKGAAIVDPRQSDKMKTLWNINTNTSTNSRDLIFSAMIYNSLLGQAGVSNFELGGYDYHDNTRTTGDAKDLDAGTVVGKLLESANALGKPLFIYVVSDGSVFSADSPTTRNTPWMGDRSSNGVAYLLYFNPNGRPATSGFQVGAFTNNQASDPTFVTGSNPEAAGAAAFANWCKANNRMDIFDRVAGTRFFNSTQLAQVVKVA